MIFPGELLPLKYEIRWIGQKYSSNLMAFVPSFQNILEKKKELDR